MFRTSPLGCIAAIVFGLFFAPLFSSADTLTATVFLSLGLALVLGDSGGLFAEGRFVAEKTRQEKLEERPDVLQVVFDPDRPGVFREAERLRSEYVLAVSGPVSGALLIQGPIPSSGGNRASTGSTSIPPAPVVVFVV